MKNNINLKDTDNHISISGKIKVSKDNKFLKTTESEPHADKLRKAIELAALVEEVKGKLSKEDRKKYDDIISRKSISKNVDPFELEYENSEFKKLENILTNGVINQNGKNVLTGDVKILSNRLKKKKGFEIARYHAPRKTAK